MEEVVDLPELGTHTRRLFRTVALYPAGTEAVQLQPGESVHWSVVWDQTDQEGEQVPLERYGFGADRYLFTRPDGHVWGFGSDPQGSVAVTIQGAQE